MMQSLRRLRAKSYLSKPPWFSNSSSIRSACSDLFFEGEYVQAPSLRRFGAKSFFFIRPPFPSSLMSTSSASALSLCSDLTNEQDIEAPVMVEDISATCKMVLLNRPHALNALNTAMATDLLQLYRSWEQNHNLGFIIMKGNGRAFCAGGDVVDAYHMINEGRLADCREFFRRCYSLIYQISTFSKPQVSILNGIAMGGGTGISTFGRFRIATDKTVFAVPELLIGFHPDGAASYYLSRLPGHLGEYLALSGDKLDGAEMVACGLATHYVHTKRIPLIEEKLAGLETNDPSKIRHLLDLYSETTFLHGQSILNRMEIINECFGCNTIEGVFEALESKANGEDYEWCKSTLEKLKQISPLSLKVSLRSIQQGRSQTLHECLTREYWMTVHATHGTISKDFCEGVRARLVDKTFAPKWDPSSLNQVTNDMVEKYFSHCSQIDHPHLLPIDSKL